MAEIWREIKGYEDRYLISDTGLVFSKISNRLLAPKIDRYGYKTVTLCRDGKSKHFTIHRLVAVAFIPNTHGLPTVNHKDENKLNNHVDNLEWMSVKENDNHGTRNVRMANAKKLRPIAQYDSNMTLLQVHSGIKDAQRNTGVNRNSIRDVCRGNRPNAGGYVWRYYMEVKNNEL
jgi:hypothetical protein